MRYPTCTELPSLDLRKGFDEELWNTSRWFAIYTRSRHEKHVNQDLEKREIETFLPLRKVRRQWSDRKKIIEEPLFKGYLFVRIPLVKRLDVLKTIGVVNFVQRRQDPLPQEVPERDLQSVRRFLEEGIALDPFPYLHEGEKVYIRSGLFKGTEGYIVRKDKRCRLVISLDLLMQSISIEIDEALVEKA